MGGVNISELLVFDVIDGDKSIFIDSDVCGGGGGTIGGGICRRVGWYVGGGTVIVVPLLMIVSVLTDE